MSSLTLHITHIYSVLAAQAPFFLLGFTNCSWPTLRSRLILSEKLAPHTPPPHPLDHSQGNLHLPQPCTQDCPDLQT